MKRVKVLLILVMIHWVTAATPWTREVRSTQGCQVPSPVILNAEKSCLHGTSCSVTCNEGYEFDFGGKKIVIKCKNNKWVPLVSRIKAITDCKAAATCNPPCAPGRTCFAKDYCGCLDNYGGNNCKERIQCPKKNQVFKTCGDSCTSTCEARRNANCKNKCVEDCTCKNGFSKNATGDCIPEEKCPCLVNGIEREDGYFELKNSNSKYIACVCSSQNWTCDDVKKGFASMTGDPHFTSIDGRRFDFMGHCVYTLLKHKEFTIEGEHVACAGTSKGINFDANVKNAPSCTKSLTIHAQHLTMHLLQNREVIINNRRVTKFPFSIFGSKVSEISSSFIQAEFADGVQVKWDGSTTAYIVVPEKYYGHAKGLLGTYNNNPNDDMTKSDGQQANSVEDFGNSWKVDPSCPNVKTVRHPCEVHREKHAIAESHCSKLKDDTFKPCHAAVHPQSFYDNCLYDICQCQDNDVSNCLCPILANYVNHCQLEKINFDNWRSVVKICGLQCPSNQVAKCGNECSRKCRDVLDPNCRKSTSCIPDCYCPEGQALNHKNICVPYAQCDCEYDGIEYIHGHVLTQTKPGGKAYRCECKNSKWNCIEQSGAQCRVIGEPHYSTFDGSTLSFQGAASYYLLKVDREIIVESTNWFCKGSEFRRSYTCINSLTIRTKHMKIELLQNRQFKVDGQSKNVPWERNGVSVKDYFSDRIMVYTPQNVTIEWDGDERAILTVPGQFYGKTKGLCGTFNGDRSDDFKIRPGIGTTNFGDSWKTDEADLDSTFLPHPCSKSAELAAKATEICKIVNGTVFKACHESVKPNTAYADCIFDVCACQEADIAKCSCPILAAYGEECIKHHKPISWREVTQSCKMECQAGQVYQPCVNICGRTCASIAALQCKRSGGECDEGCTCPAGQALDDAGKCINKEDCPCIHNNIQFKKGHQITRARGEKDFERCTCINARWSCEPQSSAWCSVVGYAHYTTFDGKKYDFMGTCTYYLVKHSQFSVEINNKDCHFSQCSRSVTVRVFKTHRIELLSGLKIKVNGQLIKSLPFKKESAYTIRRASNSQIFVTLWNSVEIRWDGKMAVYVLAPGTIYNEDTKGLCGTFNGNVQDEWTTKNMFSSDNVEIFARSWNSDPHCNISHSLPKPCEQNEQKKLNAIGYCGILEERLFSACHRDVDVKSAVANCQYDTCASSETNQKDARCPVINAYVTQCSWSDVMLPTWLAQVSGCDIQCPAGQEYQTCGSPCGRTCRDISLPCTSKCVEGCNCPEGQTLDKEGGTCIEISKCPCQFRGREYASESSSVQHRNNEEHFCTCINADWVCVKQSGARCTMLDATYFKSFDGSIFNGISMCPRILFETDSITVKLLSEEKCTEKNCRPLLITMGNVKLKMLSNRIVVFNSVKITNFPYKQQQVNIEIATSSFIVVKLGDNVDVWWDGATMVYIDVTAQLLGKTKGICGSFNSNPKDDFHTKHDEFNTRNADFLSFWGDNAGCQEPPIKNSKCNKPIPGHNICNHLKGKLFAECNAEIDPQAMYDTCLLQLCDCSDGGACTCDIFSEYASQCAALNMPINWRRHIKECAIECEAGQEYQVCHDPCTHSCRNLGDETCEKKCVEGCNCPEGRTLNDDGECIPLENCPCIDSQGKEHQHEEQITRTIGDETTEECTCIVGRWSCIEQSSAHCKMINNKFVTQFNKKEINVNRECEYFLVKQDEFSVSTGLKCNEDQSSCKTSITIEWNTHTLTLTEDETEVKYDEKLSTPPLSNHDVLVLDKSSLHLQIKLKKLGVEIHWNKEHEINVKVPPNLIDKSKGLCGSLNSEDLTGWKLRDDSSTNNLDLFARSWQVHARCIEKPIFHNNCNVDRELSDAEVNECDVLKHDIFNPCRETKAGKFLDDFYMECKQELCSCVTETKLERCTCGIIAEMASLCSEELNGANFEWRRFEKKCDVNCSSSMPYQFCGDDCTYSCAAISENTKCSRSCVEGCRCPDGESLDKFGRCIPTEQCPCVYNKVEYQPGAKMSQRDGEHVQHCECHTGRWACQEAPKGQCTNIGLTHYTTFDGKSFNFKSNCEYFLLRMPRFAVKIHSHPCSTQGPSDKICKTVKIHAGYVDIVLTGNDILIDGDEISKLPIIKHNSISVRRASYSTIIVNSNGIEVWWNNDGTIRIDVPPSYEGKTEGLCGTFNAEVNDDLRTADGDVTLFLQSFIDSWKEQQTPCEDQIKFTNQCDGNFETSQRAAVICDILNKNPFQGCHASVDVQRYIDFCKHEVCSCNLQIKCACPVFREYAQACADKRIENLPWTQQVTECAETCPAGQVFRTCGDSCRRTCDDAALEDCTSKCVEGCACPPGQTLDSRGNCVALNLCACMHENRRHNHGDQVTRANKHNVFQLCTCLEGRWNCTEASDEEINIALRNGGA